MNTMTADEFGKLINVNATDCFSLSHSYPFTAVTQWDKSIGIDLQCYTEKLSLSHLDSCLIVNLIKWLAQ